MSAESSFDPGRYGDYDKFGMPTSYGLFQEHGTRLAGLRAFAGGPSPGTDAQLEYAWQEMQKSGVLNRMPNDAVGAGAVFSGDFENPAARVGEALRRGRAAPAFVQGQVTVDVNLHGAPAGTTATATASGAASVTPPRVETAMPHAQ